MACNGASRPVKTASGVLRVIWQSGGGNAIFAVDTQFHGHEPFS
jgi:hypothetical protein